MTETVQHRHYLNINKGIASNRENGENCQALLRERILAIVLCMAFLIPPHMQGVRVHEEPDTVVDMEALIRDPHLEISEEKGDSVLVDVRAPGYSPEYGLRRPFNPDPNRAVWLSALVPGLGQVYNRRYWKLPIIVAGFMGLGYGMSWNNMQLNDYSQAYSDLMDADPNTNSYMNFFPPTTVEGDLDQTWLANTLRSRKNYYRRNRDLCIICMVGVYLLCMIDAYVDATMAHFDISPNLTLDIQPTVFPSPGNRKPAMGIQWAFNF